MGLFKKAERTQAKLRLAITGPSGSGKTYSALLIASGIVPMDKVAVIDTEYGSASLYADLGDFSALNLEPPYEVEHYQKAIRAAEAEGFELIIIDSLSPAWAGEGGLLDKKNDLDKSNKYRGNSFATWREITPKYNDLVQAILSSRCHIIATMRSKTDYAQVEENGRKYIRKMGLAPIQRDGIEYEFTTVFDMSAEHVANVSKDRTGLFDGDPVTPSKETGEKLKAWLDTGAEKAAEIRAAREAALNAKRSQIGDMFAAIGVMNGDIDRAIQTLYKRKKKTLGTLTERDVDYICSDQGWAKVQSILKDAGVIA